MAALLVDPQILLHGLRIPLNTAYGPAINARPTEPGAPTEDAALTEFPLTVAPSLRPALRSRRGL